MSDLRLPGDYKLNELTLVTSEGNEVDIKKIMIGVELYEDMYQPGMTGNLFIQDVQDLYDILNIRGGERLKIQFITDIDSNPIGQEFLFSKEFIITGIENNEQGQNERSRIYTINFVSEIYLLNQSTLISKKYSDKISSTVSDIFSNVLKSTDNIDIEETKISEDFVVPNWSALKTIDFLMTQAQNSEHGDSSYFFFENKDGFQFKSLSFLMKQDSVRTIINKGQWDEPYKNNPHVASSIEVLSHSDILDGYQDGQYGGTVHSIDISNKKYEKIEQDYSQIWDSTLHLNSEKLYDPDYTSKTYTMSSEFLGKTKVRSVLQRKSRMNQISGFNILVKVPNYSVHKTGDIVDLEILSSREISKVSGEMVLDKKLSGKYLTRGIRHIIAPGGYDTILDLVKDSI